MTRYTPPLRDMQFVLHEMLDAAATLQALPPHAGIDRATLDAVLAEGARFAVEAVLPLNAVGDRDGCAFDPTTHEVRTPSGFREAYRRYVDGGWPALACDPQYGGQGLPLALNQCFYEMLNSASQAWTMYSGLSHGAYEALHAHGTPQQKSMYLPRLVSGEWTSTMCLTEPHCGTDLGLLHTRSEPRPDGSYRLTGQKIFISAGEHDLSSNIVHLVLARLPDAPAGSAGISLFVVPKFLPAADGSPGHRNGIYCTGLEHKMGIHGISTAQMTLDGAHGTLVGQPHKGLAAMFVMMNAARLGVGNQSLGLTEVAYQNAAAYAKDRLQMRSLTGPKSPDQPADPIIVHPDVRKMLLTARAYAEGGRALAIHTALLIDQELSAANEADRREAGDQVALLTPIVKAFLTDNGWIATSHCLQVFGGHGYIRESGMEQFVRDARINMIYEGTNTIQSLDLLGRKVLQDEGARLRRFMAVVSRFGQAARADAGMAEFLDPLAELGERLAALTAEIAGKARADADEVGAAAVDYLRICGHYVFAWLFARQARIALARQGSGDPFYAAKLSTIRFYFARLLPETTALLRTARAGAAPLMALEEVLF